MIRNVVVKKAAAKEAGFSASNAKVFRATTGESLLKNSNVSNAQRINRPANNNTEQRLPTNPSKRPKRTTNDHHLKSARMAQVKEVASKAVNVANAGSAAWFIVGMTWILYVVQFVFAILSLIGFSALFAAEESWLGYVDVLGLFSDTAGMMLFVGMGMTAAMGILTLIIAIALFIFRGVKINRGISGIIMAVCFAFNIVPGFNLAPWIWVWCLYVVKSQINK